MLQPRSRVLKEGTGGPGPVVYWMSRDQRAHDNWALLFAADLARQQKRPLTVVFCLAPQFSGAAYRHYAFMIKGLAETEETLRTKDIPFFLLQGGPDKEVPAFLKNLQASALCCDFDPLRTKQEWKSAVLAATGLPVYEIDAHNVVPCFVASPKKEYGAYTIRPKIERLLPEFLHPFPSLKKHRYKFGDMPKAPEWEKILAGLKTDPVPEADRIRPGAGAAKKAMRRFLRAGLPDYENDRNDPVKDGQSGLSPYLHFGQLSPLRLALEVQEADAPDTAKRAFLEELIIRRELADNFCFYEPHYDSFAGFPDWAKRTLNDHRHDRRDPCYTLDELESADTYDELWNAAQNESKKTGKMHGYMRMYWAKKILEWSGSPEEAMKAAIYLNDRYELDGRDPNGYAGIAWSMGGVHDRPWQEREIFGKIRYMNKNGAARKFDVKAYIEKVKAL